MESGYDKELKVVKEVIIRAGEAVMGFYGGELGVTYKGEDDPLTRADLESNRIILEGLKSFGYGVLSEETKDDGSRLERGMAWIVDPIDGTKEFIARNGEFTIMIGLVDESRRPVLGCVLQPACAKMYWAVRGGGAYLEIGDKIKKLKVTDVSDISRCRILVSRSHTTETELDFARKYNIKDFVKRGSSLKTCQVAEGAAELNFKPAPKSWEWDICAADIILHEAGGRMTDIDGKTILYNKKDPRNARGFVASNGLVHELVVDYLRENSQ